MPAGVAGAPAAALQAGRRNSIDVEGDQLTEAGVTVVKIVPGEGFATEVGVMNLMNPAMRSRRVEIGLADGGRRRRGARPRRLIRTAPDRSRCPLCGRG